MKTTCSTIKSAECISYGEEDCGLLQKIDHQFLKLLDSEKIVEVSIPALISGETLHKLGYFASFPQYLTSVSHCRDEKLNDAAQNKPLVPSMLAATNMYLTPAACLHIYPMLQNFDKGNAIITTLANVYRHEPFSVDDIRLWQFKVREIVFVGDSAFVKSKLSGIFDKALTLAKKYDTAAHIEVATDHFYDTRLNRKRREIQELNAVKRELRTGSNIAIASANYHGIHFSKSFGFDKMGTVVTGCIGFGIERWLTIAKGSEDNT